MVLFKSLESETPLPAITGNGASSTSIAIAHDEANASSL